MGANTVSVLVPTYNGQRYLHAALDSILAQTHTDLEVLIRDDGSTDATEEIAREYIQADNRFRWISDGRRLGSSGNMVELIKQSNGDYVKVLNQDDTLESRCIERLLAPMQDNRNITLSTSLRQLIDENGDTLPPTRFTAPIIDFDAQLPGRALARILLVFGNNNIGEPSTVLFRNGLFDPETLFDIEGHTYLVNNDIALWSKLLLLPPWGIGDAYYVAEPLSSFRLHAEQRSAKVDEIITGTIEWSHLFEFAIHQGLPEEPGDLAMMMHTLTCNFEYTDRLIRATGGPSRTRRLNRMQAGRERLETAAHECNLTLAG